ncbi:hypothetical protein H310_05854 [Aphanomyces invadans]|uniref:Kinesin motor domain-containing protein n=1 Tax=Aphanomyces invadans TaxID=157072 RepID=A0A024U8V4_9STRA|nr:hypothetical protein H310_05854 [Aphanomyces invadans]ETW02307.1 hypothetical protein H310_05854 [Aphanomyces invadans]|eukprot:XP_008868912.1 hypothetical protein H310_05854 [Aphanomyces invadans]
MDIASAAAIVNSINKLENKGKETVKVVVRCRPLFGKEIVEGRQSIVTMDLAAAVVSIKCPDTDQLKNFTFDSVYDENTVQRQFYDESGYPLVESIFEGYNGTIFAYGQTGCGKTHTMQGKDSPPELRGVIPHAFDHVFDNINADTEREYMVRATYLEIYNEDIRDLLSDDSNKQKLELKESADGGVYVKDLTEVVVRDVVSINKVMARGFKNRTVGATLMNEGSSRSHSIFTIVVEVSEKINGEERFRAGKLNLVDLAGSERQSKTGATGARLKARWRRNLHLINLSLSALGNVISALVDGKGKHIPYRDSKLTRLLQDSLGGNTKTVMVAAISPADYNFEETLSTLRYANRAKNIKNKPTVNEDPKDAKLREYKAEIELLKQMLAQQQGSITPPDSATAPFVGRRGASPHTQPMTLDEEASAILGRVPTPPHAAPHNDSAIHRSTTDRERELNVKSQELQEQIQREKEEIQRQLKLEQESIEKAKADAAEMMEMARRMMADVQLASASSTPQSHVTRRVPTPPLQPVVSSPIVVESQESPPPLEAPLQEASPVILASTSVSPPEASPSRTTELAPPTSEPTQHVATPPPHEPTRDVEKELEGQRLQQEQVDARERELQSIRENEIARTREVEETKAKAAEMMRKAERMMEEAMARAAQPPKVKIVKEVVEVVREVVPDDHVKEKEALKEMNQTMLIHRDQMAKELERTHLAMEHHLREKSELASKLAKIGSQICGTKHDDDKVDAEVAILKQQVEFRRAQIKLKMKKKKEMQLEIAQQALQAEKQSVEEELKTAQEQAQVNNAAYKKKQSKYKAKLEAAKEEVADLHKEFARERESLMDTIHQQTREVKLMEQLVELFLPHNELIKVWEKAVWNDDKDEWQLPRIKPRGDFTNMKLPSLGGGGSAGFAPIDRPFSGGETGGAEVCGTDIPMSNRSNKSRGKTRGKIDAISSRGEDHGMDLLIPLNDVKTKLPSATKSARRDKCDDSIEGTSKKAAASSSRKKEKKKKDKLPRDDALQNNGGGPLNSLSPSLEPLIHADEATTPSDQLVCPVDMDYQPRDRLQSRQGSRQGRRVADTKSSGLGDTEDPPARRRRKSAHKTPDDDKDADGEGKSKRKKKRDKGDRTKDSAPPVSAPSVDVNLAHSLAAPSPEDPDNDDVWEDFP